MDPPHLLRLIVAPPQHIKLRLFLRPQLLGFGYSLDPPHLQRVHQLRHLLRVAFARKERPFVLRELPQGHLHHLAGEPLDPWRVLVEGDVRNLVGLDAFDQVDVVVGEDDVLPGLGVLDGAPEVRVFHALQEVVQLVAGLGLDYLVAVPVVPQVLVVVVPVLGDVADGVADVFFVGSVVVVVFVGFRLRWGRCLRVFFFCVVFIVVVVVTVLIFLFVIVAVVLVVVFATLVAFFVAIVIFIVIL